MAKLSRRERRELERKERKNQIKNAQRVGLSKTDSRLLIQEPIRLSKEQKRQRKNLEKKYNYRKLRSLGYTTQEAKRFQGASAELIEQLSKTLATPLTPKQLEAQAKAGERARKIASNEPSLVVYWEDYVENEDQESVDQQKALFRFMDVPSLENAIMRLRDLTHGLSPASQYKIQATKDLQGTYRYWTYRNFNQIYEGKAINYKALLRAIATMMVLLYDPQLKRDFLMDMFNNVRVFSNKNAARIYRLTR